MRYLSRIAAALLSALLSHFAIAQVDQSFVQTYCYDCHQGTDAEAGFDLASLSNNLHRPEVFDSWVKVVDRVEAGEMPPADYGELPTAEVKTFLKPTVAQLRRVQQQEFEQHGRVRARRLTNVQLERTLHDLLGIDIPLAAEMPEEARTDGFTTVAAGQPMSHFHLETHLDVVDKALDEAFRRATTPADEWSRSLTPEELARRNPRRRCREPEMLDGKAVVWSSRITYYGRLPVTTAKEDGWYRIRMKASALNVPDDHGVWCTVRTGMCVSSAPLLAWVGGFEATEEPQEWTFEAWLPKGHMFEIRPGDATLKIGRFGGGQVGTGEGTSQNLAGLAHHGLQLERFHKGPSDDEIRRRLFGDLKIETDKRGRNATVVAKHPTQAAEQLVFRFAEAAFRRPVDRQAMEPYVRIVHEALADGDSLLNALRSGYRAILCSPRFLHFVEEPGQLDDHALANRLSYFLWGSLPDAELRQLADQGRLTDSNVLAAQTERLLNDPRGKRFVRDFGGEWLDLHQIDFTEPDRRLYPGFDLIVEQSMLQETHRYLQQMLDQNLSVSHVIDSDFTFLNSRLANYYGIEGVDGDQLQHVKLQPQHRRGGLLTHGSVLKVTANGTNTSPVLRGVWVSERLLGVDIPPPPENVPAIEPDIRGAKSIREMLALHKESDNCASCHRKIDPPGFALENFDPSGRWRDRYRTVSKGRRGKGMEIDASFELPDGRPFDNLQQFQKLITADRRSLARNVVRKLVAYGTGASCEFADRPLVEQIVDSCEDSNYGLRSLLTAVVQSELFRKK